MTILHVTDFHFNKRWFDWLLFHAPHHDLLVMSGDMLNLFGTTPHRKQIEWVSDWINDYPRPMCVCSGNHDLEWQEQSERWKPAHWLRELVNPNVWSDGQRVELHGLSILNIGCTTQPKGGAADIWVVHAPPTNTLVAVRANGGDSGDPDLITAVRHFAPRLLLSGHMHNPIHWRAHAESTIYLNPGHSGDTDFPNHILVHTERMSCQFIAGGNKPDPSARTLAERTA
jgi:Icc-related predicted phosphoesterase